MITARKRINKPYKLLIMIKIDKQTKEITTDCKTVGEFMTEAAAIFDHCAIIVDGCRYEFHDSPKVRVTDGTPIGSVTMADNRDIVITTKPRPKTVTRHGWMNLYHNELVDEIIPGVNLFDTKEGAAASLDISFECEKVATARLEWEEEVGQ